MAEMFDYHQCTYQCPSFDAFPLTPPPPPSLPRPLLIPTLPFLSEVHHHMVEMFNYHQYTILAPTDEAFRKLPKWKQDKLFKSTNLVSFLLQHYVRTLPPREYNYLRGLPAGTKVRH